MPSLFSFLPARKPGVPRSTTKADMLRPFLPAGSVIAITTQTSPTEPWVQKALVPLRIQPPSTAPRRGARRRGVGARAGLGQRPGADPFAGGELRDPALALRGIAELVDVVGAERIVRRHRDADRRVDLRQLGHHEDVLDVAESGAAQLLGEEDAEEAELGGLGHDGARELLRLVELLDVGGDFFFGELARRGADRLLLFGQGKVHSEPPRGGCYPGAAASLVRVTPV